MKKSLLEQTAEAMAKKINLDKPPKGSALVVVNMLSFKDVNGNPKQVPIYGIRTLN